jgi:hypothetical protein
MQGDINKAASNSVRCNLFIESFYIIQEQANIRVSELSLACQSFLNLFENTEVAIKPSKAMPRTT